MTLQSMFSELAPEILQLTKMPVLMGYADALSCAAIYASLIRRKIIVAFPNDQLPF